MGYADRYPEVLVQAGLSEALLAIAGASRQPGSYAPEQTFNDAVPKSVSGKLLSSSGQPASAAMACREISDYSQPSYAPASPCQILKIPTDFYFTCPLLPKIVMLSCARSTRKHRLRKEI